MTDDEEGNQRKFQRPATATLMRGSSIVSVKRGKSHNTRQCSNVGTLYKITWMESV